MKRLGFNNFLNEDILTLLLSIILWVFSLLVIFFVAQVFFRGEKINTSGDAPRINRYYEEISVSAIIR